MERKRSVLGLLTISRRDKHVVFWLMGWSGIVSSPFVIGPFVGWMFLTKFKMKSAVVLLKLL